MQTRDVTLRDYFRVFAAGRWALIIGAVSVALIALVVSLTRPVKYSAESLVYMGIQTNSSGQPMSTPWTTPVTAVRTLKGDEMVAGTAERSGIKLQRVRDGISATVDRVPGAAGGNQPTVAILTFTDKNKKTAISGANAYAETALGAVQGTYDRILTAWKTQEKDARARVAQSQADINRLSRQGGSDSALVALQGNLQDNLRAANDAVIGAATQQQFAPSIVSRAETVSASSTPRSRIITTLFGAFIGLVLGAIVALVWKGSPAEADR